MSDQPILEFSSASPMGRMERSSCWDDGRTWESCCAVWNEAQIGRGNPDCFAGPRTYESCCPPTLVPRDIFTCESRGGESWKLLRYTSMLAMELTSLPVELQRMTQRPREECLLGHFIASMLLLAAVANSEFVEEAINACNYWFVVILRSPISLDEILGSGWPFGEVFKMVRQFPSVQRLTGSWTHAFWNAAKFVEELPTLLTRSSPQDLEMLVQKLCRTEMVIHDSMAWPSWACASLTAWTSAWALKLLGAEAPAAEQLMLKKKEAILLQRGYFLWRGAFLNGTKTADGWPRALMQAVAVYPLLTTMLTNLQLEPTVRVFPLKTFRRPTGHDSVGLPTGIMPPTWREGTRIPSLVLHVLPISDAASNAVRATRQAFCGDVAFLSLLAQAARQSHATTARRGHRTGGSAGTQGSAGAKDKVKLWEIGSNLGDCSFLAVLMLSSWGDGTEQQEALFHVDAELFEPIGPVVTASLRSSQGLLQRLQKESNPAAASAAAVSSRRSLRAVPRIRVRQLALGAEAGQVDMQHSAKSAAQSSLQACPDVCTKVTVDIAAVDDLISDVADCKPGSHCQRPDVIDCARIHVQGNELEVLRGAQRSLEQGRICVVILNTMSMALARAAKSSQFAVEMLSLLHGYSAALISDADYQSTQSVSAEELARHLQEKKTSFLVAWHLGHVCRSSPAVEAALQLWGGSSSEVMVNRSEASAAESVLTSFASGARGA